MYLVEMETDTYCSFAFSLVIMGFLERVKDEFVSKYGGGKTALLL